MIGAIKSLTTKTLTMRIFVVEMNPSSAKATVLIVLDAFFYSSLPIGTTVKVMPLSKLPLQVFKKQLQLFHVLLFRVIVSLIGSFVVCLLSR